MRRIVTGIDSSGRSVVTDERELAGDPISTEFPGTARTQVWGADGPVDLPVFASAPSFDGYWPRPGGFRFTVGDILPDSARPDAPSSGSAGAVQAVMEDGASGFHRTDTVDIVLVLSGEPTLELDDGVVVPLHPGNVVVQNGTRHAWRNRTATPCRITVALFGATRRPDEPR